MAESRCRAMIVMGGEWQTKAIIDCFNKLPIHRKGMLNSHFHTSRRRTHQFSLLLGFSNGLNEKIKPKKVFH
jgi:hypothetical protein